MSAQSRPLRLLHRRLAAGMGLASLAAFISGAGLETPTPLLAVAALLLALVWAPGPRLQRVLDPVWRIAALVLTARALLRVFTSPDDVVLPMVDLLLVLLISESLRESGTAGDSRVYSLSFALLVAACAYRPGVVFAVSFIAYTAIGIVTIMVGHLIRKLAQHNARDIRLDRAFLLRIAAMSGVMLTLSAIVFTAFPRVSRGWAMRGAVQSASVVGFSDRVSLGEHGSRIYPNPEVVLRVEFPDGGPPDRRDLYWRGRSYDYFDGVAWGRSPTIPVSSPTTQFYANTWRGPRTRQRIYAIPLDVPVLFGLHPILNIQPHSRMRAMQDNVGDMWYFGTTSPTYDVVSMVQKPGDEQLRATTTRSELAERYYLQVPPLSDRVRQLADSLTRGIPTRFDKVMAVQNWLLSEFSYTLDLPATPREATLENFLFRRRAGHCEYFSTALAILLREAGVPARNVNGFLGGTWNEFGKFMTVSQNEAHSWVEVYFPEYGWVPFDATPAATTDIAQQQQNWLGPLRGVMDGLEHRWNKWILEYNLETQVGLFRRATEQFAQRDQTGELKMNPALIRAFKYAVGGIVLLMLVAMLFRRSRLEDVSAESRLYLRLRRAYERAGYDDRPNDPAMMFLARMRNAHAPGFEAAADAIALYLRSRFGGEDIGEEGKREMREAADQAIREVHAARRTRQRAA